MGGFTFPEITLLDQIFINKWKREPEPWVFCLWQPSWWSVLLSGMDFARVLPQSSKYHSNQQTFVFRRLPTCFCVPDTGLKVGNYFYCAALLRCAAPPASAWAAAANPDYSQLWNSHVKIEFYRHPQRTRYLETEGVLKSRFLYTTPYK